VRKVAKQRLEAKTLVVDASVARAAGEQGKVESSSRCRQFLDAILECGHRCAMDSELRSEWARHEGGYAKRWRTTMVSRRRVIAVAVLYPQVAPLLDDLETTQAKKRAMNKDIHLVEVALLTDRRIVSLDNTVRTHFQTACERIELLRKIYWSNPVAEGQGAIDWLRRGAPDERLRLLTAPGDRP
jgi:hypothetical protein